MHGVRSNTHFLTFKSSTHHGLKGNNSKSYEDNMDAESSTKKTKSAYGHTRADIEAQILEWHEESKIRK